MKRSIAFVAMLALTVCLLAACGGHTPSTGSSLPSPTSTSPSTTAPQTPPADPWADYEITTIAKALELCDQFVEDASPDRYYIRGVIKEIQNESYGQMVIEDSTGSIMVYGTYSADGTQRYPELAEKPVAGDEVLLYGNLQNYNGNTKEIKSGWIIDFIHNGAGTQTPELPAFDSTLTVAELLALPLKDGQTTEGRYYVRAAVSSITDPKYGAMTIADKTGSISVYGSASADGSVSYADMENKPYKGDEVLLYATVQNFRGTIELKSAWITEIKPGDSYNESDYTEMTIDAARRAETGTLVKVTGVVARITYATGMKPSGVILVDGTNAIYVYDNDLAARVAIGNKLTVLGSKTMWILESESANAAKFGYQGCNQLEKAWLLDNDGGSHEFDTSWIQGATVKEIMDTPASTDITTTIFKVTALVKKDVGNGFVNYYFNDLDGTTGSYTYTQCSGSDFAWLDEFDGKICTVYLSALNAKSSDAGCVWRFLPIAVMDEGFDPSSVSIPENAVKYYGIPQFLPSYSGNPALELLTSAKNDLLGYADVALSYASADTSVIVFETVDGKTVMNCVAAGTTKITVTAVYNDSSYSEEFEITVTEQVSVDYTDVNSAIQAAVGESVTVKGIVGPSLVNRDGFYLIDKTGVIAVITTGDVLATLEPGQEVILQGVRHINTKGGDGYCGQTCLKDCQVLVNYYGEHAYATDSFAGEISVADFYNLDITKDFTTSVYTMKATVVWEETQYYANILLSDGTTSVRLYCSNAKQYAWLQEYAGQEITVEIAPCNWNDKTYYTGCVLAVVTEDGKSLNTFNFDKF